MVSMYAEVCSVRGVGGGGGQRGSVQPPPQDWNNENINFPFPTEAGDKKSYPTLTYPVSKSLRTTRCDTFLRLQWSWYSSKAWKTTDAWN